MFILNTHTNSIRNVTKELWKKQAKQGFHPANKNNNFSEFGLQPGIYHLVSHAWLDGWRDYVEQVRLVVRPTL